MDAMQRTTTFVTFALFFTALLAIVGIVALVGKGPGVAFASANLAGDAGKADVVDAARLSRAPWTYLAYDAVDAVLEFRSPRGPITVPLSGDSGVIVSGGKVYAVILEVPTGKTISIDTDADGVVDKKVEQGGQFRLQ